MHLFRNLVAFWRRLLSRPAVPGGVPDTQEMEIEKERRRGFPGQ